ncbi:MAG: hypothetical protein ACI9R3_001883 [Verrucomicrobiales bacterium]
MEIIPFIFDGRKYQSIDEGQGNLPLFLSSSSLTRQTRHIELTGSTAVKGFATPGSHSINGKSAGPVGFPVPTDLNPELVLEASLNLFKLE